MRNLDNSNPLPSRVLPGAGRSGREGMDIPGAGGTEEVNEMATKKAASGNSRARTNGSMVAQLLDRIQGKESTLELDFEKVGLKLGGDPWLQATGTVRLSAVLLR